MAWNWTTCKSVTSQTGFTASVITALVIGGGALLWYERAAPHYVTSKDIAEIAGAMNERRAAGRDIYAYGYPLIEPSDEAEWTNDTYRIGYYPSRAFFMSRVTTHISEMTGLYYDLWAGGGTNAIFFRSVLDYPAKPIAPAEFMALGWWKTNVWKSAAYFGDFPYLHTNTFYVSTNLLSAIARPLSAMRWTIDQPNTNTYILSPTNSVTWTGLSTGKATKAAALAEALGNCVSASPEFPFTEPTDPADVAELLENANVLKHEVYNDSWQSGGLWYGSVIESVECTDRTALIPPMTNLSACSIGVFSSPDDYFDDYDYDTFYHPDYTGDVWVYQESTLTDIGGGLMAFPRMLHLWDGRFSLASFYTELTTTSTIIGWNAYGGASTVQFLCDWRFQCLTNRSAFWP